MFFDREVPEELLDDVELMLFVTADSTPFSSACSAASAQKIGSMRWPFKRSHSSSSTSAQLSMSLFMAVLHHTSALSALHGQGPDTSGAYKKNVAEFAGIPTGSNVAFLRQASENLNAIFDGSPVSLFTDTAGQLDDEGV